jgi:mannose-6-phosphate isomerase-like protein (cupin superfamily)
MMCPASEGAPALRKPPQSTSNEISGDATNAAAVGRARNESVDAIEKITWRGIPLAYIVRSEPTPSETAFITPPHFKQQVGFVVYPAGGEIQRHVHRPLRRLLVGTSEVLVVRQGRCEVDIYTDDREFVATAELREGDIVLMVGGGHGFRILEDTVLLEVKQGPYTGEDEKERF